MESHAHFGSREGSPRGAGGIPGSSGSRVNASENTQRFGGTSGLGSRSDSGRNELPRTGNSSSDRSAFERFGTSPRSFDPSGLNPRGQDPQPPTGRNKMQPLGLGNSAPPNVKSGSSGISTLGRDAARDNGSSSQSKRNSFSPGGFTPSGFTPGGSDRGAKSSKSNGSIERGFGGSTGRGPSRASESGSRSGGNKGDDSRSRGRGK